MAKAKQYRVRITVDRVPAHEFFPTLDEAYDRIEEAIEAIKKRGYVVQWKSLRWSRVRLAIMCKEVKGQPIRRVHLSIKEI